MRNVAPSAAKSLSALSANGPAALLWQCEPSAARLFSGDSSAIDERVFLVLPLSIGRMKRTDGQGPRGGETLGGGKGQRGAQAARKLSQRAELWARLTDALAPFLRQLMGPALDTKEPLHLYVLAPGSLRALPIAGLRAGDQPLLTAFRSVTHLPALKFADHLLPVTPAKKTACLFAASAPDEGMLEFGRATIKTLRAAFPVHAIEPRGQDDLNGPDIVENDAIRAIASDLACLRIYRLPGLVPSFLQWCEWDHRSGLACVRSGEGPGLRTLQFGALAIVAIPGGGAHASRRVGAASDQRLGAVSI